MLPEFIKKYKSKIFRRMSLPSYHCTRLEGESLDDFHDRSLKEANAFWATFQR